MKNFHLTRYSWIWLSLSGGLVALALFALAVFGLNFGIDFTGGSLLEARIANTNTEEVRSAVLALGKEAVVQAGEGDLYFVRMQTLSEEEHQSVLGAIKAAYPEAQETRFDSVGPAVGNELKRASITAMIVLVLLIGAYIAWAFRKVSEPVASWKYGIITMVTAFHDVILPLGVFAVLGKYLGYQVDTAFVAALLTILGYSINDTIVVFDRTRENLHRHRFSGSSFGDLVDRSVFETLGRSLNTTLTTLLPLLAIFFLGGETTRPFVLALIVGIASGAYSSIFVASPLLVVFEKWKK